MADALKVLVSNSKKSVVVIEAAVLLTAGWEENCHEVNMITKLIANEKIKKCFRFGVHLFNQMKQLKD